MTEQRTDQAATDPKRAPTPAKAGEGAKEETYREQPGDRAALDNAKKIADDRGVGTQTTRERSSAVDAVSAANDTRGDRTGELHPGATHEQQAQRASGEAMAPAGGKPEDAEAALHREGRRDGGR